MPNVDQETSIYNNVDINSKFYDVDSFLCNFKQNNMPIFLNLNIQSLNAKHDKLKELTERIIQNNTKVDIIALQETWHIKYANLLDLPGYQKIVYKNRTNGRGGGIGFYVKNGLNFKIVEPPFNSFVSKIFESLTLEITDNSSGTCKQYIVSNIYRSPTLANNYTIAEQLDEFFVKFDHLLAFLNTYSKKSYVFLDSNINMLDIVNNQFAVTYLNAISNNGFLLTNLKASRMRSNCNSLIDHILTNDKSLKLCSGSVIDDISDHWITFLQPHVSKSAKQKSKNVKKRLVTTENLTNLRNTLSNLHWIDVLSTNDVNTCYDVFWTTFKTLYDLYIPLVTTRFNRNFHRISNFMTKGLMTSRRTKIGLLRVSITNPSDENKQRYKLYRNLYNKLVRLAKKNHINDRLENSKKNPKKTWEILSELTGRSKSNLGVQSICSEGREYTDSLTKANIFNKFFCGVGEQISNSVEPTAVNFNEYLTENPNTIPLEFGPITQAEFITIIDNLEAKSSTDIDGISNKMLKFLKFELATPLVHLFNLSIQTGNFPDKLKMSRTVPIFKSGDPKLCDNYRPISLLSSISKVLEKAVACRLVNHLKYNKLLNVNQFGFQEGYSTVHNLLKLTNYVASELNKKNYTVGIFLDLKKAFDVVPHSILLKKLKKLGIGGVALRWFTSYLEGRSQKVEIEGQLSDVELLKISILQGSILGPILFLCFINDLPNCTDMLSLLFADDTAGLTSGPDLKLVIQKANLELQKLSMWFRANKMAVNVKKTKYIIFKPKSKKVTIEKGEGVLFNNNDLNEPNDESKIFELDRIYDDNPNIHDRSFKLLGVYLDENLSFNHHCNFICNKLSQSNYIISRVKNMLPRNALRTLYFSLFHPHLLYCLPLYSCTTAKNLNKIKILQKKVIRSICNSNYNEHTEPLFTSLNILPFDKLVTFSQGMLTHSIIHKYSPPALHGQWIFNHERNVGRELRNEQDLYVPLAVSEQVKKLPLFAFAENWNKLPYEKQYPNPITFKIALLDHLKNNWTH
jgi:Reverse transcriptase (RNA-dependent DNA polymerase)